ncbi:DJ-1/PfpI family protein [Nonomuraea guangzhouensis]|uniref:DJ-1/PfpI family protein n=1 Tax=Nonomuraea guangzhouensis TaxID=1291555 RepID=A0ABW4G2F6_9ACTN|nr:DJ-1/PfpI family protein [Nonomuraea guangzhouensis]
MQVAVVTFDGFNELDSFIASGLINRARPQGVTAYITTPTPVVTSMNGVEVTGQRPLDFVAEADAVLLGSGIKTRDVVADDTLLARLPLDPARQLIGSQCSGALVLAQLGLLAGRPACTDTITRPWLEERGVTVLDEPFHAEGAIATAGGCLASVYLAAWTLLHTAGEAAAWAVIEYAAPVGEKQEIVQRVMSRVRAIEAALH